MADTQHRFRDEWLLPHLDDIPQLTENLLRAWRSAQQPYVAQPVVDAGYLEPSELHRRVEKALRVPPMDEDVAPDPEALRMVPEKVCREHRVLPLAVGARKITVAMANPADAEAEQALEWIAGRSVEARYCLPKRLDEMLFRVVDPDGVMFNLARRVAEDDPEVEVLGTAPEAAQEQEVRAPVIRLVNALISDAVQRGASDIHLEHEDIASVVRYRIDGHLRNMMSIPRYTASGPMVARFKIMANLDIATRHQPQDGRAKLRVNGAEIGLRVSTLPAQNGEKVVVRILDERAAQVPFERLGLRPETRDRLQAWLRRPQGVVLVTGPTGSGKTTTLYSAISRLRAENVNIVTVEDPVEYKLHGITQVQVEVKKGLTFASALRSVLRQDPDIVLVGEIRDRETADIALQAAMTGHLVLSTLHTNDAVSSIARLADLGVEPFKLAAGVRGITAQRLVRRLCGECSVELPAEEMDDTLRRALEARFGTARAQRAVGCDACGFSGYRGRLAVVELLEVGAAIEELIGEGAPLDDVRRAALEGDLLMRMEDDVLWHIQHGHSSPECLELVDLTRALREDERAETAAGPASSPSRTPGTGSEPPSGAPGDAVSVVLVEEDDETRASLGELLRDRGMSVMATGSGTEALRALRQSGPDLLLVGLRAGGMDGASLIDTTRSVLGLLDLPVLAVAGEDPASAEAMMDAGADDYVTRPITPRMVVARVNAALGRKEAWSRTEAVMRPGLPVDEVERMRAIDESGLRGGPPEAVEALTREAQERFGVPMAFFSLVDGKMQRFMAAQGVDALETPRDLAPCAHAIHQDDAFVIEDLALDARFSLSPLLTGDPSLRFYAGAPIRVKGQKVGMFCVADSEPRRFDAEEREALKTMAKRVEAEIGEA